MYRNSFVKKRKKMVTTKLLLLYFGVFVVDATINSYPNKTSVPIIKQVSIAVYGFI